jgi:hypothetical protein
MLEAYAATLRQPSADSGRVGDEVSFSTVEKVVKALCRIGHTFPESQEEQAARFESLVLDLCRSVQSHFDGLTALAAQGQGEAVAWQINATRSSRAWEPCTRECYEDTLRTGRYMGLYAGTRDVEVRALYTHPTPAASPAGVPDGTWLWCKLPDPETMCAMWTTPTTPDAESIAFLAGARQMRAAIEAAQPTQPAEGE